MLSSDPLRPSEEGQLLEAWYNATDPANSGAGNNRYDGFNYDQLGNRAGSAFVASHGAMTFTRKDNGLNQYSGWWPYCFIKYDDDIAGWGAPGAANGVQMQDGNTTAGFNALNQPIMIVGPGMPDWEYFGYDPLGRCVKRWIGGDGSAESNPATYLYYEGWNLIQEGTSYANASRNYVHGARVDEIVKQITPNNWWERYFQYDARGHCTLQTDAFGNINEQYEYDAFGQPYFFNASGTEANSSAWGNRFLFTGREYLSELKLYDYRNRLYQPELGRFMQPDPKEFGAGDYNLYRYCHNDPINKSDPTGLTRKDQFFSRKVVQLKMITGSHIPQWVVIGSLKGSIGGLFDVSKKDHEDRTQSLYKDHTPSNIEIARVERDNHLGVFNTVGKTEFIPNDPVHGGVDVIFHIHHDVTNNSTSWPSETRDWNAVKGLQRTMVFSSESLFNSKTGSEGVIVSPNGQHDPTETRVRFE